MNATAEQLPQQGFDERLRHHNDTVTWLAETLNGSMRTSFEYRFDGQELYAEDGGGMGEVFDDSIAAAKEVVEHSPNLLFMLRRSLIEAGEYQDMLAMARGESPNTMIIVSDFPPELKRASKDVGGYNVTRQQTMLRIISRQEDGSIRIVSQSLDGSNRQALEAIFHAEGVEPEPGELLGQRIHRNLPAAWQDALPDNLRDIYDDSLSEQDGGSWRAGIKQPEPGSSINTATFAEQQTDLLDWFVKAKLADPIGAERLRYGLGAAVTERYKRRDVMENPTVLHTEYSYRLEIEIEQAIIQALQTGKTFSGCGISLQADALSVEDQLEQAGYGNKADENDKYSFNKIMHCVVCQSPPKKNESKKACGPCGICRGCDRKLGGKG